MNPDCLKYRLTSGEHESFHRDGYLIIKGVLSPEEISKHEETVDKLYIPPKEPDHFFFKPGVADYFIDLADCPKVFPKVWGLLGWNIYIYHTHLTVTPPCDWETSQIYGWHQDSAHISHDLNENAPLMSVKVAYFLNDMPKPDMANFCVIPGSQHTTEYPTDTSKMVAVCVDAGDVVIFDRRIWHSSSVNLSDVTRKVMFIGYSYRWLLEKDDGDYSHLFGEDDIMAQLFGCRPSGKEGCYSPKMEDRALWKWLRDNKSL